MQEKPESIKEVDPVTNSEKSPLGLDSFDQLSKRVEDIIELINKKPKARMRLLKRRNKILFSVVVSFSIVLIWYGLWDIITWIPVLNNPIVACVLGFFLLSSSGYWYINMTGQDN